MNYNNGNDAEPPILRLNDDCLILICRLLPLSELCAVADTCTQFKAVACTVFKLSHRELIVKVSDEHFKGHFSAVRNFGNLVTSIIVDICLMKMELEPYQRRIIFVIQKYCFRTLQALQLKSFHIDKTIIPELKKLFEILKELKLYRFYSNLSRIHILDLFSNCKNLVKLEMENTSSFLLQGKFPLMESFCYKNFSNTFTHHLEDFIKNHKNLKELTLATESRKSSSLFPTIGANLKKLEKLCSSRYIYNRCLRIDNFGANLNHLTKLKHLKHLVLVSNNHSVSKFMSNTLSVEALEYIQLVEVKMDDDLIRGLAKLNKLRVLRLKLIELSKAHLEGLASLEQLTSLKLNGDCALDVQGAFSITDRDVLRLVDKMPNLKELSFWKTGFIFNENLFNKIVKIRRDKGCNNKLIIWNREDHQMDMAEGKSQNYVEFRVVTF